VTKPQLPDHTAMIEDYVATREDERSFQATQVALASLALTTLGALAGLIGRYVIPASSHANPIPPGLLVLTPLVPLALFCMFAQAGAQATLRNHYLRDVEEQLAQLGLTSKTLSEPPRVPNPSFIRLSSVLVGLRHGSLVYRATTTMLISIAIAAFVMILVLIGINVPGPWAAGMAVTYASAMLLLAHLSWIATTKGRSFYQFARTRLVRPPDEADRSDSKLLSYLALPRPADFVKSLYYVAGCLLAGVLGSTSDRTLNEQIGVAIWGWIVLEFLSYQARYQWNDIRGRARDKDHPMAADRRRLPDVPGNVRLSGLVAAWRIGAAVILALGGPLGSRWPLLAGIVAIFALAAAYETARFKNRQWLVIFLVALGYPLRFFLGLAVAGYALDSGSAAVIVLGVVAFAAVGWSTVGLTWTLEADHVRSSGQPPKNHQAKLWWGAALPLDKPVPYEAPLKRGYPWLAIPNIAQLIACAAVVGLAHLATPSDWSGRAGVLILLSAAAMLGLILLGIRGAWTPLATAAGLAAVAGASFWSSPDPTALWAPIFWLAFVLFYLSFRSSTYEDLNTFGKKVKMSLGGTALLIAHWLESGKTN